MDSKVVNREIKKTIWPALKAEGFDHFTSRAAWRHGTDAIDVVEFQSFNKYNADVLGVTTFSFSVNLGKFLLYVPPRWPPKSKDGALLPSQPECLFRGALMPTVGSQTQRTIWSIDTEGKNLMWAVRDVLNQVPVALNWFARLSNRAEVLRILVEDDEAMHELWGFGRNPSPSRAYATGYVALSQGDRITAASKLQEAVDSKCFVNLFTGLEGALSRAA